MGNVKLYYERLQLSQITNTPKLICANNGSGATAVDGCNAQGSTYKLGSCNPLGTTASVKCNTGNGAIPLGSCKLVGNDVNTSCYNNGNVPL